MIPKYNKNGYLPKGIHKATVDEIKQKFGSSSPQRIKLFKGINSVIRLLHKHRKNIKKFILNGSYVTSKESPGDFDYIVILKKHFDFSSKEAKLLTNSKELFNGHLLAAMEEDTDECSRLINFFGHDREGKPKGVVEVIL